MEPKKKSTFHNTLEFIAGFLEESNKEMKEKNKKKCKYTEKQLDNYCLEEWQKKLVREGKFEPWNFGEDDLEEEDYYYEDDK